MIYQSQVSDFWGLNSQLQNFRLDKNAHEESLSSLFSIYKAKLPLKPTFENGLYGYIEKQEEF